MPEAAPTTILDFILTANNASGFLALVFVAGVGLTLVTSPILRWRYRRAIDAEMRNAGGAGAAEFDVPAPGYPNKRDLEIVPVAEAPAPRPENAPLRRALALRYLAAGISFALAHVLVIWVLRAPVFTPLQWGLVMLAYALPLVGFAHYVAGLRWTRIAVSVGLVTALLLVVDPAPSDELKVFLALPVLAALVLGHPALRTTTQPVFAASLVFFVPIVFYPDFAYLLFHAPAYGEVIAALGPPRAQSVANMLGFALAVVLGLPLALLMFRAIGRLTAGSSKFMMQGDILVMLIAYVSLAMHWFSLGPVALLLVVPVGVYRAVLWALKPRDGAAREFYLLLRVFDQRRGQLEIARGLLTDWRQRGPVMLIGGADLATETLDASELAAFLHRRLDRLFIDTPERLAAALEQGNHRLGDGLYPVQDYYCRANSWQPTVLTLMSLAERVLIDMRGFAPERAGIRFEIEALSERVPSARIVVLADPDTVDAVSALFVAAWRAAGQPGADRLTIHALPARRARRRG